MSRSTFSPLQYIFDTIHRLELDLAASSTGHSPLALPEYEDFQPPALTWLGRVSRRVQLMAWFIVAIPCVAVAFVSEKLRRGVHKS